MLFIYSCSARLISFEMNLKTTDFKLFHPLSVTAIRSISALHIPVLYGSYFCVIAYKANLASCGKLTEWHSLKQSKRLLLSLTSLLRDGSI